MQVKYELLDCNHTFLESVLKLVGLMESGVVRDGEDLVPFLFQFLVLLAHDNSQLVSIPEVFNNIHIVHACMYICTYIHNTYTYKASPLVEVIAMLHLLPHCVQVVHF